jgi:predicted porin
MKKSLLALAVLGAFAGAAQAQTGVTVYGSFDGGIRHVTNANAAGDSKTSMSSNGTYNSNRIGFKGTEDLGGGLNAHFALETGFNTGTGALDNATTTKAQANGVGIGTSRLFNRTASVGIGGAWGSVDLGRQYSINFQTIGMYDPFNYKYTGILPLAAQGGLTRLDNDIKYTGNFGPVTHVLNMLLAKLLAARAMVRPKQLASAMLAARSLGAAYTQRKNDLVAAANPAATTTNFQDQKNWTLGGAYATGPFRVAIGYADNKQDTGVAAASEVRVKDTWLGGSYSLSSAAALSAAYYHTKGDTAGVSLTQKLFIVGGTYALSKRTNFYADIDNKRFDVSAGVAPKSQTGISVGINHLF